MAAHRDDLPLSPYRVIDLTGRQGALCGRILGDLGADVIKVEPPGGDPARAGRGSLLPRHRPPRRLAELLGLQRQQAQRRAGLGAVGRPGPCPRPDRGGGLRDRVGAAGLSRRHRSGLRRAEPRPRGPDHGLHHALRCVGAVPGLRGRRPRFARRRRAALSLRPARPPSGHDRRAAVLQPGGGAGRRRGARGA